MSRPRRPGTVRARITLVAALTVAVVLAIAAVGLILVQRRVLVHQLEESLRTDVDQVLAAVDGDRDEPTLLVPGGDDDAVAQVVTLDGEVLAATPNIAGRPSIAPAPVDEAMTTIRSIEDDEPYRLLSMRASASNRDVVVHVAAPLDDISAATRSVGAALAVAVPLVTALLAALVFLLVGRTLRPVERIRREVDEIGPDDLDRRVPQPAGDDEIARLATTMNTMLGRLERGDRRQRRFVADASHELRTPLARIRAELEVDLRHPDLADDPATTQSVLDEVEHLQRLVEDLLVLARHDTAGAAAHPAHPVDLDALVLDEVRAAAGPHTIDVSGVSAAQVLGDANALRRATRNVLDNAVRHATAKVCVTLAESRGEAVMTVVDDGPGIPPERCDDVFERFATLDDARTGSRHGTGLGLAITRAIVHAHGGTIEVDARHHPGARLVVRLPATTDAVE